MSISVEEKMLITRAEDTVVLCEKQNCIKFMGFLTPADAETVRRNMPRSAIQTVFSGGYPCAERTLFVALPDYLEEDAALDLISVVEVTGRDIGELKHPDYLGSLLGLGIKREKIGDILVCEDKALVFVVENIADYIIDNLDKIGRKGVKLRKVLPSEVEIPQRKTEMISATVAALRLDSIVAAAIRTSRSAALSVIAEGRVFLNWTLQSSPSAKVKPGDVFSVRGKGRFRLSEEINETKKGRLGVCIEKMV